MFLRGKPEQFRMLDATRNCLFGSRERALEIFRLHGRSERTQIMLL
jgi:hypothetical protein